LFSFQCSVFSEEVFGDAVFGDAVFGDAVFGDAVIRCSVFGADWSGVRPVKKKTLSRFSGLRGPSLQGLRRLCGGK
jgi:hypothetical protein